MRVQTLGLLPRSFAPETFHTSTGIAIPRMTSYVPSDVRGRGTRGLGEAGLTESIGLLSLGAVVGGALGFVIGAGVISWATSPRSRW
jgi:hypothetical protein